ncbi:TPR repeat [Carpediemonas membranifera]|uniref:TPR repeat n=1 Tax=Carpediemonas membranifera TaxID=201153 RepID=A0A8J6B1C1_9EUKA|nr:TPR repeat [Carpediemonas membranifera]|eukprot:KAG9393543.1 TPR repeat [Carpediemonas membranifera]
MSNEPRTAETLKEKANEHYRKGEFLDAVDLYLAALDETKETKDAELRVVLHSNTAQCYTKLKRYKDSIFHADKALSIDGQHSKTRFRRAVAASMLPGCHDQALKDFHMLYSMDVSFSIGDYCQSLVDRIFSDVLPHLDGPTKARLYKADPDVIQRIESARKLGPVTVRYLGNHPFKKKDLPPPPYTIPMLDTVALRLLDKEKNLVLNELKVCREARRGMLEAQLLVLEAFQCSKTDPDKCRGRLVSAFTHDTDCLEAHMYMAEAVCPTGRRIAHLSRALARARPSYDRALRLGKGLMWTHDDAFARPLVRAMSFLGNTALMEPDGSAQQASELFQEVNALDILDHMNVGMGQLAVEVLTNRLANISDEEFTKRPGEPDLQMGLPIILTQYVKGKLDEAKRTVGQHCKANPFFDSEMRAFFRDERPMECFGRVAGDQSEAAYAVWSLAPAIASLLPGFKHWWCE